MKWLTITLLLTGACRAGEISGVHLRIDRGIDVIEAFDENAIVDGLTYSGVYLSDLIDREPQQYLSIGVRSFDQYGTSAMAEFDLHIDIPGVDYAYEIILQGDSRLTITSLDDQSTWLDISPVDNAFDWVYPVMDIWYVVTPGTPNDPLVLIGRGADELSLIPFGLPAGNWRVRAETNGGRVRLGATVVAPEPSAIMQASVFLFSIAAGYFWMRCVNGRRRKC